MVDLNKIVENLNLPKQILDKTEALAKTLFGPSFAELGSSIADEVRARRWKNQLKIYEKAQQLLKEKGIQPKNVSLKVLAPLIEFSSYEEDSTLQDKWSNLIVNVVSHTEDVLFHQNCISVLNKLSCAEAKLLDELETELLQRVNQLPERHGTKNQEQKDLFGGLLPQPSGYSFRSLPFHKKWVAENQGVSMELAEYMISNLATLGVLIWDIDVDVSAVKANEDPDDTDIDVDVDVDSNQYFLFTRFGHRFVQACKNK